jgi:hypothetical protein
MSKPRENACSVPFRPSKQVLVGQLFFLQENTSGCTQIWHRRCDKDWLQEGGATSLPMAVSEIQQTGMDIDMYMPVTVAGTLPGTVRQGRPSYPRHRRVGSGM